MIISKIHLALLSGVDSDISDRFLLSANGVNDAISASNVTSQLEWGSLYWLSKLEEAGLPLCVSYVHAFYTAKSFDVWIAHFNNIIVPILNTNDIVL